MRTQVERQSAEAEKVVRDIWGAPRRQYSSEEKMRIVIAGLRGEESIAELCRKECINQNRSLMGGTSGVERVPVKRYPTCFRSARAARYLSDSGLLQVLILPQRRPSKAAMNRSRQQIAGASLQELINFRTTAASDYELKLLFRVCRARRISDRRADDVGVVMAEPECSSPSGADVAQ